MEDITAWCMKCKEKVKVKDGKGEVTKNRMMIVKGKCPNCDTNICRILGKEKTSPNGEGEVPSSLPKLEV